MNRLSLVLMLCLLACILWMPATPAFAHAGHHAGKLGHPAPAARAAAAMPHVGQELAAPAIAAADLSRASPPVAPSAGVSPAPPDSTDPDAALCGFEHRAAAFLGASNRSPAEDGRCLCAGPGCGFCSSAACCAGAVLPSALTWIVAVATAQHVAMPGPSMAGRLPDPLPRPPNPLRPL